jgi:hypothetical protein
LDDRDDRHQAERRDPGRDPFRAGDRNAPDGGGFALSLILPAVLVGLILTAPILLATVGLYFAVTVWGVRIFDELQ